MRRVPLIVLGVGQVGSAFLAQLLHVRGHLQARYAVDLCPVALADSSGVLFDANGVSDHDLKVLLAQKAARVHLGEQPGALEAMYARELVAYAAGQGVEEAIVVDATAAAGMEPALRHALEIGYGVVLANKRPLAGAWEDSRIFFEHPRAQFEATVGGGLPVLATLRAMVDTGDRVERIEGALSGTLGYLCSRLEDGEAFSVIVGAAKARGYTEPDPREDLSGVDVARKMLILGRTAGWSLELGNLTVDPLYPSAMAEMSVEDFMSALPRLDSDFAAYIGALAGVPRYLAEIGPEGGLVSLRMVGERLAAQLRGRLNQVTFWTQLYHDRPLTISGPGIGRENAAAALLRDCLQLARTAAQR
ncbi:MAG TPA: hypothetical protein PKD09_04110 [Aggregatilinea sp.]|uniref:hypothetical protein n=1 Tax=Aggregatilinea sp. TaxID=2806333 RepID=UPI002BB2CCEC|nr:hypothetical protein [Aggregatilinea sp.]HML20808.1 hypothetical protein [Aggregatilinea sp.]